MQIVSSGDNLHEMLDFFPVYLFQESLCPKFSMNYFTLIFQDSVSSKEGEEAALKGTKVGAGLDLEVNCLHAVCIYPKY